MSSSARSWLSPLLVGLLGLGLFLNTLPNDFVLDDLPAIAQNPAAQAPVDLERVFTTNYWGSPRDYEHLTIYRPLATLSFALGSLVHGDGAAGHHLVNALLHGLLSALVFLLAGRVGSMFGVRDGAAWAGALVAGLLFAVHPVHVEAVAGAVSRAEILAGLFVVATLLCALRAHVSARPGRWWALGALFFGLGLLSKENAVTALLMLPLVDLGRFFARRRQDPGARLRFSWPLLAGALVLLAGYLALRAAVLPGVLGGRVPLSDNPIVGAEGAGRWLTPFAVYLEAWRLLLWPVGLSVDYTAHAIPLAESWADLRGLAGLALFGATLGGGLALARRAPGAAFALGIFLAAWSVVSHLAFPATVIFGERLLYLPSVGFCLLAGEGFAAGWRWLPTPAPRRALAGVAALLLLAGGALTVARNAEWRDEFTLYATSAARTPGSSRLQSNLGRHLRLRGDLARAERCQRQAVAIDPANFAAWNNLAQLLLDRGAFAEAEAALAEALSRKGDSLEALNNLCVLRLRQGRLTEAEAACRAALALSPDNPVVQRNLRAAQGLPRR